MCYLGIDVNQLTSVVPLIVLFTLYIIHKYKTKIQSFNVLYTFKSPVFSVCRVCGSVFNFVPSFDQMLDTQSI